MLKVYFTASTSFDGEYRQTYQQIISLIENHSAQLISGKQITDPKLLNRDKKLTKKQIFQREKNLIDNADCIIAEVTKPSLGVGGEIVYALTQYKTVLALVYTDHEDNLSPMIAGNPSDNLFLEHYDKDNVHLIIQEFLIHVSQIKKKKGKLVVIDGGDGSGKTTQANLLVKYLKQNKIPVKYLDFPRYYTSFHGRTVAKFLRGEFGKIDQVSPYLASLAYALDRAAVRKEMNEFLQKGGFLIANRYATSNMAHQGAKFKDTSERENYIKWVYELEYKVHKIPKEDLVIYLHVPWQIGLSLTNTKPERNYLKGKSADIHEKDLLYRQDVEEMYLELSKRYKHWVKVDCTCGGKLLSPGEIHKKVVGVLKERKIIV